MDTELKKFLKETKETVDPVIINFLSKSTSDKFQKLAHYQIQTGGKRLRPALTILSCLSLDGDKKEAALPGAAIETTHNYTLIIDDIIDRGKIRRGEKTTVEKFGQSITECVGMLYSTSISEMLVEVDKDVSKEIIEATKAVIQGEIIDILQETSLRDEPYIKKHSYQEVNKDDYFEMINKKTASLIKTACKAGAMLGNREEKIDVLASYGKKLGIAYQIQDDILDIFGDEDKFGKEIGKDIKERKRSNIIILLTLKESDNSEELQNILGKQQILRSDVKRAIDIIDKTDSYDKATEIKNHYIREAKEDLTALSSNQYVSLLGDIADYLKEREK